jgi:cutinase
MVKAFTDVRTFHAGRAAARACISHVPTVRTTVECERPITSKGLIDTTRSAIPLCGPFERRRRAGRLVVVAHRRNEVPMTNVRTNTASRWRSLLRVLFPWIVSMTAAVAALADTLAVARADTDACPDVAVVFARGTFEAPGVGKTGQAFIDALDARLGGETVDVYPVDYPASLDFPRAADGIVDATNKITMIAASCPSTKVVLGGYSQGAAVAGYTTADTVPDGFILPDGITGVMPPTTAAHVAAVALFGKPSEAFLNLIDRNAPPVIVGQLYAVKTIELCLPDDPVCSPGGSDRSAHSAYKDNGMAEQAADFAVRTLSDRR